MKNPIESPLSGGVVQKVKSTRTLNEVEGCFDFLDNPLNAANPPS
jgi:hypothetical protein